MHHQFLRLSLAKNSKMLLCSNLDNSIVLWDKDSGRNLQTYKGHLNENYLLPAFIINGEDNKKRVIAPSEDQKNFCIWDINQPTPNAEIKLTDKVKYIDVEENDETLVACILGKSKVSIFKV